MMAAGKHTTVVANFQSTIETLSLLLRIPTERDGNCYGFAMMGILAGLAEDLTTFKNRLILMKEIKKNEKAKALLAALNNAEIAELFPLVTDNRYQDIENFLTIMNAIQSPEKFPDFFPEDTHQENSLTTALLPIALQDKTIQKSKASSACYTREETMIFLETIKSLTKEQPIALLLGDIDHAISIIYNPIDKKKWTLIDINKGIIHLNTEADLSKAIFESFHEKESDTKELVAFSTEIFHIKTPEQSTSLEASIDELNSTNEQWIAIHQITDTKKDNPDWLSIAIQVKDNNTVKKLLAEGANPNARNKDNEPHLLAAIQNECDELAMLLINHKDINVNQPYGKDTILNSAVRRGNINIVKALLVKGAEVNPMTSDKLDIYSPLNTAVTFISNTKNPSKAETYIEIIILLLRANANPNRAQIKTIIKQENLMNQIIRQPDAQILLEKLQTADPATSPIMIALRRVHLAITAAPKEPTPPTPLAGIKRKNPCCTVATAITDHIIKKSRSEEEPAAEPTIG